MEGLKSLLSEILTKHRKMRRSLSFLIERRDKIASAFAEAKVSTRVSYGNTFAEINRFAEFLLGLVEKRIELYEDRIRILGEIQKGDTNAVNKYAHSESRNTDITRHLKELKPELMGFWQTIKERAAKALRDHDTFTALQLSVILMVCALVLATISYFNFEQQGLFNKEIMWTEEWFTHFSTVVSSMAFLYAGGLAALGLAKIIKAGTSITKKALK